MIVYPMGLPPYDEVQHILNDTEDLSGRDDGKAVIAPGEGQLWWAGKELSRSKKLSDYIGKNEKVSSVPSALSSVDFGVCVCVCVCVCARARARVRAFLAPARRVGWLPQTKYNCERRRTMHVNSHSMHAFSCCAALKFFVPDDDRGKAPKERRWRTGTRGCG